MKILQSSIGNPSDITTGRKFFPAFTETTCSFFSKKNVTEGEEEFHAQLHQNDAG